MVILSFKCNSDVVVGGGSTVFTYSAFLDRSPQFDFLFFFTDFKTEEQLLSYIHENYQKTVAAEETVLYSCARNMISAIKAFLKAKGTQELEVREPEVARPKCNCCLVGLVRQFIVQYTIQK